MGDDGPEEVGVGDVNSNLLIIPTSTGDAELDRAVRQWLSWDKLTLDPESLENFTTGNASF